MLFGLQSRHQHGGQPPPDAGQGHDPAVHLLWRLVADSLALAMGLLLAVTRRRPRSEYFDRIVPAASRGGRAPMSASTARPAGAGGTGGHLFPAEALAVGARTRAAARASRDRRARRALSAGLSRPTRSTPSRPRRRAARSPVAHGRAAGAAGAGRCCGMRRSWRAREACRRGRLRRLSDRAAGLAAARCAASRPSSTSRTPCIGRANRFLAPRVAAIATGFPKVQAASPGAAKPSCANRQSGAPAVLEAAQTPYPRRFRRAASCGSLVFGGSQGARVMTDIVPAGHRLLSQADCARASRSSQQARDGGLERVRTAYAPGRQRRGRALLRATCRRASPTAISWSPAPAPRRSRNSPSIGRPSILVPLPHVARSATRRPTPRRSAAAARATVIPQADFTPERLAGEIAARLARSRSA